MKIRNSALVKFLASPKIFYFSLYWLMVLLFWGTVAQKYIGLYQSQQKFFSSWILWLGPIQTSAFSWEIQIPSPGGFATMTVIAVSLLVKLSLASPWRPKNVGIMVTHFGALMLLGGSLLTFLFSSEGSMVLDEGATSNIFQDYHQCELAFVDTRPKDADQTTAFSSFSLVAGKTLQKASLPFKVQVMAFYANVEIVQKTGAAKPNEKSMASRFDLKEAQPDKDENRNRSGIRVAISGLDAQQDGEYLLFEDMSVPQTLQIDEKPMYMGLRKIQHQLPFAIELIDFEKQVHPGTGMARSYKSVVNLIEGRAKRRLIISMNEPLRTQDYTLYQSSFSQVEGRETSVLTVVKNAGRVFPYISSIIICIGILIHLVLHIPTLIRRA